MAFHVNWDYPIFVLKKTGENYVCLPGTRHDGEKVLYLPVFSSAELAAAFAAERKLEGQPHPLASAVHFRNFLRGCGAQVWEVLFDPDSEAQMGVWAASVDYLLLCKLPPGFEWDYPLYAVELSPGVVACVEGRGDDGMARRCVLLFTDDDLAERFIDAVMPIGRVRAIADPREFARFLRQFLPSEYAAFDLTNFKPGDVPRRGCRIETLLKALPQD